MITRREYLMGRDLEAPLTPKQEDNLLKLLGAINMFRAIYGKPMIVSSGYRTPKVNAAIGGAKKSKHLTCEAVDILDRNREIALFCLHNLDILQKCGLWIENPEKTPGWVHFQCVPPRSRNLVFNP